MKTTLTRLYAVRVPDVLTSIPTGDDNEIVARSLVATLYLDGWDVVVTEHETIIGDDVYKEIEREFIVNDFDYERSAPISGNEYVFFSDRLEIGRINNG
jgi:hypothetical protein